MLGGFAQYLGMEPVPNFYLMAITAGFVVIPIIFFSVAKSPVPEEVEQLYVTPLTRDQIWRGYNYWPTRTCFWCSFPHALIVAFGISQEFDELAAFLWGIAYLMVMVGLSLMLLRMWLEFPLRKVMIVPMSFFYLFVEFLISLVFGPLIMTRLHHPAVVIPVSFICAMILANFLNLRMILTHAKSLFFRQLEELKTQKFLIIDLIQQSR